MKTRMLSLFLRAQQWTDVKRIIHADVRKCFDRIEHNMLLQLLTKHIKDYRFLDFLNIFMKTPILGEYGTNDTNIDRVIPQGAIVSPILMNAWGISRPNYGVISS
jgi:retron-type reverse transcriptase